MECNTNQLIIRYSVYFTLKVDEKSTYKKTE